jgi:hypothetical protein
MPAVFQIGWFTLRAEEWRCAVLFTRCRAKSLRAGFPRTFRLSFRTMNTDRDSENEYYSTLDRPGGWVALGSIAERIAGKCPRPSRTGSVSFLNPFKHRAQPEPIIDAEGRPSQKR